MRLLCGFFKVGRDNVNFLVRWLSRAERVLEFLVMLKALGNCRGRGEFCIFAPLHRVYF